MSESGNFPGFGRTQFATKHGLSPWEHRGEVIMGEPTGTPYPGTRAHLERRGNLPSRGMRVPTFFRANRQNQLLNKTWSPVAIAVRATSETAYQMRCATTRVRRGWFTKIDIEVPGKEPRSVEVAPSQRTALVLVNSETGKSSELRVELKLPQLIC